MKTYPIPDPLLQEIVVYLRRQPWQDVNNILAGINNVLVADQQASVPKSNGGIEAGTQSGVG
jgi:hypothetical protein